jgi:HAD superfamily hydrolase (TIGR01490 family)
MRLALFDLDDTLIDGDSDVEWSDLLAGYGAMDATRTRAFHVEYEQGTLDIDAFLRYLLEPLAREPIERLLAWRREYLVQRIRPRIRTAALELVRQHARAGHDVVLITAMHRFLVEPIAEELAIKDVIASEAEVVDGRFTGRVAGTPCFREGKIACLREWLASRGLDFRDVSESWFYSDSHNDVPLLSLVTHPVCVNPDRKLAAHAQRLGWPVLDLRDVSRQIETEYSSPPIG